MAAELQIAQARCTTPSPQLAPSGITPLRTAVETDDHGWEKYSGTVGFRLNTTGSKFEAISAFDVGWWLGYYFTLGQPSDGQFEEVVRFVLSLDDALDFNNLTVRLYNDSGTFRFRLWNATEDVQVGSDSPAVTVGNMFVNVRANSSANTLALFLNGSSAIEASIPIFSVNGAMIAGTASTGTDRYWSAWCHYRSGSDDLNVTHYPEMRMLHPAAEGAHDDYSDGVGGAAGTADWDRWNNWADEGNSDEGSEFNNGIDGGNQRQTSILTTHTMTNPITGLAGLFWISQNVAMKSFQHSMLARLGGTTKGVSFGNEDLGTDYLLREAVMHTPPGGGSWPADLSGLEGGHLRNPGDIAVAARVSEAAFVVVALGPTDLTPPGLTVPVIPPVTEGRRSATLRHGGLPAARPSRRARPRRPTAPIRPTAPRRARR